MHETNVALNAFHCESEKISILVQPLQFIEFLLFLLARKEMTLNIIQSVKGKTIE